MTITLATVALVLALVAQPELTEKEDYNHPEFVCHTDESGRFLALLRNGNSPDRTGHINGPERRGQLTVFEYLRESNSLRKLYEVELLSIGKPLICMLSRDGRFFLTIDEFKESGTGPFTVVIYDLARKESTAYAGKDFLNEKLIKSLPVHGFLAGFKWRGKDLVFNQDNTKFYPTLPSNCAKEKVPFVVIDLPTRTISVPGTPGADPDDVVLPVDQKWGWRESRELVKTQTSFLPARVKRSSPGLTDQVFGLADDKSQYAPLH